MVTEVNWEDKEEKKEAFNSNPAFNQELASQKQGQSNAQQRENSLAYSRSEGQLSLDQNLPQQQAMPSYGMFPNSSVGIGDPSSFPQP